MRKYLTAILILTTLLSCDYTITTYAINHSREPVDLSFKTKEGLDQINMVQADSVIEKFKYKLMPVYGDSLLVSKDENGRYHIVLPPESTTMIYQYLRSMRDLEVDGHPFDSTSGYITHWGFFKKQVYNWPILGGTKK